MNVQSDLEKVVKDYRDKLKEKINNRKEEMIEDDFSHYLIYNVLGVSDEEGFDIDVYQNVGRFLYKYAGAFVEDATVMCFKLLSDTVESNVKIPNTIDNSPKRFEIDCLYNNKAIEIKWRDATTDGDHIKKEHKRVQVISESGYKPIRVMFFEPNRQQAKRIQKRLKELYESFGGEYYAGEDAWTYVHNETGIDLKKLFNDLI